MAFRVYAFFGVTNKASDEDYHPRRLLYTTEGTSDQFIVPAAIKYEINKAESFEFDILPNHKYYNDLKRYTTYICVLDTIDYDPDDSTKPPEIMFYGRISSITINFDRTKKVTCEGLLSNLKDSVAFHITTGTAKYELMNGNDDTSAAIEGGAMFMELIQDYRYGLNRGEINYDPSYSKAVTVTDAKSSDATKVFDNLFGQDVLDCIKSELIDEYGGYLKMVYTSANNSTIGPQHWDTPDEDEPDDIITGTLYWLADPTDENYDPQNTTSNPPQPFQYGLNILEVTAEYLDEEPVTGITAQYTYKSGSTTSNRVLTAKSSSAGAATVNIPKVFGKSTGGVKMITLPGKYSNTSGGKTAAQKAEVRANRYAKLYCHSDAENPRKKYTIKALDMHYFGNKNVRKFRVMDNVGIGSLPHDAIDQTLEYFILSAEINIMDMTQNVYTIGDYTPDPTANSKILSLRLKQNRRG